MTDKPVTPASDEQIETIEREMEKAYISGDDVAALIARVRADAAELERLRRWSAAWKVSAKDFRNFNTVSYRAGQNAEAQAAMLAAALAKLKDAYEGRMGDAENADWYDEFNEAVAALTPSARAAGELWRAYEKLDEAARAECCERMFPDADMPILFEALQAIEAARKELEK